jgi:hypothetical protein
MALRYLLLFVSFSMGCATGKSNEARLDDFGRGAERVKAKDFNALMQLKCDELQPTWAKVRDEPTEERQLLGYGQLFEEVKSRVSEFDTATNRNPDLIYGKSDESDGKKSQSQEVFDAREGCVKLAADVRAEFEAKVRELVNLPLLDESKGGRVMKVARLNLERLRQAIDQLELEDKDDLNSKLSFAEKLIKR